MTLTERLKLEVFVREQIERHGEEFFEQLAVVLERVQDQPPPEQIPPVGRFRLRF